MAMQKIGDVRGCGKETLEQIFERLLARQEVLYGPLSQREKCVSFLADFWMGVPMRANRTHQYNVCSKHYPLTFWAFLSGYFYPKCQRVVFKMVTARIGYAIQHSRSHTIKKFFMHRGPDWFYPTDFVGLSFCVAAGSQSAVYMNTDPLESVPLSISRMVERLREAGYLQPFRQGYMRVKRPFKSQLLTLVRSLVDARRLAVMHERLKREGWDYVSSIWRRVLERLPVGIEEALVAGFVVFQVTRTLRFGDVSAMGSIFDDEERAGLFIDCLRTVVELPEMEAIQRERHHARTRLFEGGGKAAEAEVQKEVSHGA